MLNYSTAAVSRDTVAGSERRLTCSWFYMRGRRGDMCSIEYRCTIYYDESTYNEVMHRLYKLHLSQQCVSKLYNSDSSIVVYCVGYVMQKLLCN